MTSSSEIILYVAPLTRGKLPTSQQLQKGIETKELSLTGMMSPGMNGMTGSPAPGNYMQQVSPISKNNLKVTCFFFLLLEDQVRSNTFVST